ncbi:cysteine-rich CWC family protein [Spirosoma taeanense]|uniref:Cysteine-rich CWC family protein n=1 Tax=Spirosoma taeanense TaxID=2735870 RepID=A0A6M5Y4P1_9BACT|nr:cysteine-rich CWC family protein [Spirosoma taeanense]QJW89478.1 cysteine-rich CWC family protein [Spirosoma taeanense]
MNKHTQAGCPRCHQPFICKVNSILKCDCLQINLTHEETQYIRDKALLNYDGDCFCLNCLHQLKAEYHQQLISRGN